MRVVLLSALLAASGCDAVRYEPEGENVVDVPEAEPAVVDLVAAADTVVLWGRVDLRYDIEAPGEVLEVRVLLDDRLVASTQNPKQVSVSTLGVRDGFYRLRVAALVSAGTGSLSDRLGGEWVEGVAERTALVDNAPPGAPVVSAGVEEGFLEVRWTASTRLSFEEYRISRDGVFVATITDRAVTSWRDPRYTGGPSLYRVFTRVAGTSASGQTEVAFQPASVRRAVAVEPGVVQVSWSPTSFTGAFSRYVVSRALENDPAFTEVATVRAASDTIAIDRPDPGPFGTRYVYSVRTEPSRNPSPPTAPVQTWPEPDLGANPTTFVSGQGVLVGPGQTDTGRTLTALDAETFEERASISTGSDSLRAMASPTGDRLVTTGVLFTAAAREITERDPATLAVLRTFPLESNQRVGEQIQVTDDGRVYFDLWEQNGPTAQAGRGVGVLNLTTGTFEAPVVTSGWMIGASGDGRYVIVAGGGQPVGLLERQAGGGLVRLGDVPVNVRAVLRQQAAVVAFSEGQVAVYQLPDFSVVRTFAVDPEVEDLDLDEVSGYLYDVTFSEDRMFTDLPETLIAYDPEAGAEVGRLAVSGRARFPGPGPRLVGGRVWWDGRTRALDASRR
ncbi:MAG: fibronectin type III domain-containing protein [Bacteroidota bacterium]